jgi:hypothetical protein
MSRRFALAVVAILAAQQAGAQTPNPLLTDDKVREALHAALKNIGQARCETFQPCAPATPDELRTPPISLEQARSAIRAGLASGGMEWCKLDWQQRSFRPMMEHFRRTAGLNERQMALMALLHGMHQGMVMHRLGKQECTPEMRVKLQSPPERS